MSSTNHSQPRIDHRARKLTRFKNGFPLFSLHKATEAVSSSLSFVQTRIIAHVGATHSDIAIYACGIMFYKFGLEYFNGAFITIANERFGEERYKKIGILTGLNSAMQCVSSGNPCSDEKPFQG
jgi:hypothetical protein